MATRTKKTTRQSYDSARFTGFEILRLGFRICPNPVLIVGQRGDIFIASRAAEKLLGWPNGSLHTMNVDQLIPKKHREKHRVDMKDFLLSGDQSSEPRLMKDGRSVPALNSEGGVGYYRIKLRQYMAGGYMFCLTSLEPGEGPAR